MFPWPLLSDWSSSRAQLGGGASSWRVPGPGQGGRRWLTSSTMEEGFPWWSRGWPLPSRSPQFGPPCSPLCCSHGRLRFPGHGRAVQLLGWGGGGLICVEPTRGVRRPCPQLGPPGMAHPTGRLQLGRTELCSPRSTGRWRGAVCPPCPSERGGKPPSSHTACHAQGRTRSLTARIWLAQKKERVAAVKSVSGSSWALVTPDAPPCALLHLFLPPSALVKAELTCSDLK